MFRKYEKTFRILHPKIFVGGKHYLSSSDVQAVINDKIIIEEKIDGANTGIIGGKKDQIFRLQKRGSLVDVSEHPQFNRFKAWTNEHYEQLMNIRYPYIVYGEFMWATHHIYYDQLPDWFICFDVWDGEEYLNREDKEKYCEKLGINIVPLLYCGYIDSVEELIPYVYGKSEYSSDNDREGIVIKNYRKQMRAKLVRGEFVKEINEDGTHWSTKWDPRKINQLIKKG